MFSSLKTQGALDEFVGKNETIDSLLSRARSYILVNALVCNLSKSLKLLHFGANARLLIGLQRDFYLAPC